MKICIWCRKTEEETDFKKKAHTIPQSLGGKNICDNVCDRCNHYFGAAHDKLPPIETVLKETFNLSRALFLKRIEGLGRNKSMARFKSIYFNIDFEKGILDVKFAYRIQKGFQEKIGRQMKRGIYKMLLEEIERQFGNAHDEKFNFIREYARYNLGDYPIFYFNRKFPAIAISDEWVKNPALQLKEDERMQYLIDHPSFIEFEFLGHVLAVAKTRRWDIMLDDYFKKTTKAKEKSLHPPLEVKKFNDIDLALRAIS